MANGQRPLPDYMALAADCSADLIDYPMARFVTGSFGRLLEALMGRNLMLAWACFRQRQYPVIFTDGENVGIQLAILLKFFGPFFNRGQDRPRHLMITHWLSVPKKRILFGFLHLETHVDTFIVYSTWQKQFIEKRWRVADKRVIFTPFMVDAQFFSPEQVNRTELLPQNIPQNGRPLICAVGLELRDYLTLVNAVRGLDIDVVIAADSPWSKRQDAGKFDSVPANVHVSRYSWADLRLLYSASAFVVVPLYNVTFQAGITSILEAMAMGKAVICSRTPGQSDIIADGVTGLYVVPEDADALREAINCLLAQPELAEKIGRAARQQIETFIDLPLYSRRLAGHVAEQLR
jgi:glycosyltransferase involved in cell wall biosynthesis